MPAPTPALEPQDVLEVLRDRDREEYPIMSSHDIHEELERRGFDIGARTTKYRLSDLHEAGEVRRRKAGNTPVYWLPGDFASLGGEEADTPDVATSGGVPATGEAEELVELLNELKEDIVKINRQTEDLETSQENLAESVAQVLHSTPDDNAPAENTIDTWGERAAHEAEETFRLTQHAAVGFALVVGLWIATRVVSPGVLNTPFPVFGQVAGVLAFFTMLLLGAVVFGGGLVLLYYVLWRADIADRAEARFGDAWRDIWADDQEKTEKPPT